MMIVNPDDWKTPLVCYLENPGHIVDRNVRRQALKCVMLDNTLYHRTIDGLLLKCLGLNQSKTSMGEVHEGISGTHQSAHKGCESCQKFGGVQLAPVAMLQPVIKPWPFHGWGLDIVGQIHPTSSKGHQFVLVATDYFTKWTEDLAYHRH
jgi:hypothetical protein